MKKETLKTILIIITCGLLLFISALYLDESTKKMGFREMSGFNWWWLFIVWAVFILSSAFFISYIIPKWAKKEQKDKAKVLLSVFLTISIIIFVIWVFLGCYFTDIHVPGRFTIANALYIYFLIYLLYLIKIRETAAAAIKELNKNWKRLLHKEIKIKGLFKKNNKKAKETKFKK